MLHFTFQNMSAFYGPWPRGLGLIQYFSLLDFPLWFGYHLGLSTYCNSQAKHNLGKGSDLDKMFENSDSTPFCNKLFIFISRFFPKIFTRGHHLNYEYAIKYMYTCIYCMYIQKYICTRSMLYSSMGLL